MRVLLLLVASACGGSSALTLDAARDDGGDAHPDGPPVDPLAGIGTVDMIQGGFQFIEGPQWREASGDLVFSDINAATIYKYVPGGAVTVFKANSGNSNGLALDGTGALIACEHGTRSVTRDGTAIASTFEGHKLNSPNDVTVAGDGTIYFTDPPYGIQDAQRELDFMGVFRIAPGGALTAERRGALTERPNGIGLSPSGTTLYVDDTDDGNLYAFPRNPDGSLGQRTMLAHTAGGSDGLAIDTAGNIFVTANGGIDVFAPDGTKWGSIAVPKKPANCAFGDADHQMLYITATDTLYKVRLAHPGLPTH